MPDSRPEAQTIRSLVMPLLEAAGWSSASLFREYPITAGQLSVVDGRVREGRRLRADFALMHGTHPIGVVEAKPALRSVHDGVQQARRYAARLDLPVAYATNGHRIIEIDTRAQTEREVDRFRTPDELWEHFRSGNGLHTDQATAFFTTPYSRNVPDATGAPKTMRYYQHIAVQKLLAGIAEDRDRLLAVLATGTGKTAVAAQLVHILWQNHWPRGAGHPYGERPRVLYLADRDVLITQPMRDWFQPIFGDTPMTRIKGRPETSRHLYFALYQALDHGDDQAELFREFDRDWFDLVIVDECHRGSAAAQSSWRQVLDHFSSAVQIGLTATPVYAAERDVDTVGYFGDPVYTYSLRQGIEDGFLAPFEVLRVRLDRDIDGVHIPDGTLDRAGEPVAEGTYELPQFERRLVLPERTQAIARYLTDFLRTRNTTPGIPPELRKTIVFCVNQEHAADMRHALANLNADLLRRYGPTWVVRIVSDEGELGKTLLEDFQRADQRIPTVVTTSQLLTTGVDVPTTHVIVLARGIESMVAFKQIIGRGTRLARDFDKEYFTIVDFVGATGKFDDPEFDGPPIRVIPQEGTDDDPPEPPCDEPEIDDPDATEVREPEPPYEGQDGDDPGVIDDPDADAGIRRTSDRQTVDGYDVYVTSEALYVLDTDGERLRRVRYEQWVRERMHSLHTDEDSLRAQWATAAGRRELRELLSETLAFDVGELGKRLNRPDCDPIDLLISMAWDVPLMSRRERAARFTRDQRAFLDPYSRQARQILTTLVDKYVAHGVRDLSTQALLTPPLSELGSPAELADAFGGVEPLHRAIDDLGRHLFQAS